MRRGDRDHDACLTDLQTSDAMDDIDVRDLELFSGCRAQRLISRTAIGS